jgi:hypothetical protein
MAQSFTPDERNRLTKLLVLAKESPYPGERQAALTAAERMAARKGLSLEDAARFAAHDAEEAERRDQARRQERAREDYWARRAQEDSGFARRFHHAFHAQDSQAAAASRARQRQRWAEEDAERRAAEDQRMARNLRTNRRRSHRRIPPYEHARILILDTNLPLAEIAKLTGLSLHEVIAMKLKLRPAMRKAG